MNVEVKHIDHIQYIVIDLFCGAGGTTLGYEDAELEELENILKLQRYLRTLGIESFKEEINHRLSKVIACVNHDPIAIKSHWENHKHVLHFEEDITLLYGIIKYGVLFKSPTFQRLIRLVDIYRAFYPTAKIVLWASLECTNFSKAKGGKPRDADSRTLADHLHPYIIALNPDYIKIENVVEFMAWGPLDENGKPISRKNGQDWLRWRESVCDLGYEDEWREINSADFGALTSRNRLFGCFAKNGLPIVWPEPTHSKKPEKTSIYKPLKKWEAVKKALDFSDEGTSVFNRWKRIPKVQTSKAGHEFCKLKKYDTEYRTYGPIPDPLSPKTFQRLYMGCVKHIAGGKKAFLSRYYGGNPEYRNSDLDSPAGTLTTSNRMAIVKASFIDKAYSGKPEDKSSSIEQPSPTITTIPHESLVQVFITKAFSSNSNKSVNAGSSVEAPCPTVAAQNRLGLAKACFIQKYNSNRAETGGNNGHSVDDPAPVIATQPRMAIAQAHFISRYNGVNGGKHDNSHSTEGPVGALGTGDNHAKVSADFFLDKQFSGDDNHQSIEAPAGSILTKDKHNLVRAEKWLMNTNYNNVGKSLEEPAPVITADRHHHYLINPSWGGNPGSIDQPCPVVVARQDKAPLYLITCQEGPVAVPVYEGDCEWTIKLKEFMALYGICDIKMRMLKVIELKVIQGFPEDYILLGSQADQKKFIGNSVHKVVPENWIKAFANREIELALAA